MNKEGSLSIVSLSQSMKLPYNVLKLVSKEEIRKEEEADEEVKIDFICCARLRSISSVT